MATETDPGTGEDIATFADRMIDVVTLSQQDALVSADAARSAMVEGIAEVQGELAAFVGKRMKHDLEVSSELLRCRDLADLRELQCRYLRATMDQYAGETSRLMRLGADIAARSLEPGSA